MKRNSTRIDNPIESNICLPVTGDEDLCEITFEVDMEKEGIYDVKKLPPTPNSASKQQKKRGINEEDSSLHVVRSEGENCNEFESYYRFRNASEKEESESSEIDESNADEILFGKNLSNRYQKNVSTQEKQGDFYEPKSSDILSDLALSMELICLSTENQV